MELSSSVTTKWNLFTIGSVLGCLILILLFNKNDQILNLWATTTSSTLLKVESVAHPETLPSTISSQPPIASVVNPPSDHSTIIISPPNDTVVTASLDLSHLSAPPQARVVPKSLELPNLSTFSAPPLAHELPNLSAPPQANEVPQPLDLPANLSTSSAQPQAKLPIEISAQNALEKAYHKDEKPVVNNATYVKSIGIEPINNKVVKKCNIYDGKWVYNPDGKPSYMALQCPFMEEKMSCQRNKRPDMEFEKWYWEANDCDIPLLNGTDMVEKFKNKRVIFVGDSLNRNMWESLSCILYSNIPNASSIANIHFQGAHRRTYLKVKEGYNFTVEFFWTPYLVERNLNHSSGKKVLVLDKLSSNSESWVGADVMIFNSGMHWIQLPPKKGWDAYEYNGKLIEDMPLHIAFKRGMKTWAKWVQNNVDPKKTALFFRSVSAEHLNKQRDQWCVGKTKPIMDESYVSSFPKKVIRSIEDVIKGMKKSQVKINYMNVTKMSQYRIDAHPSIYRYNDWKIRAQTDLSGLKSTADCGHWCLPGIPDTWNRMLYASLYFDVSL